jgi:CDP-6-deoxy-D-xylo-4-hexulose-3-dehydrase
VNSGSSANLAAALALAEEIGPGAHAVIAGFTFPTTISSLLTAGFDLTVADTQADGFGLDPMAFERAIRPETRLVCVTHFLGFPADLKRIRDIANERSIRIMVDACETMNLSVDGLQSHDWADLVTWSFYHPHHLSAFGGGAVIAANRDLRRRVESISHWGRACTCHFDPDACQAPDGMGHYFTYERVGHNLEMSELNACMGRFQLASFPRQEMRRKEHYACLRSALEDVACVAVWAEDARQPSPFVFPIRMLIGSAKMAGERLRACGVEVRTLMGGDITSQPAFRSLSFDALDNCRRLSESTFFVGIHQTLADGNVADTARILRRELPSCA